MKNRVVTIGREFGSGGHEIGSRLAKRLGFKFYDKELITIAAEKTGCCESFVMSNDEKTPSIFTRGVGFNKGAATYPQLSPEDNIFVQQSLTIRELGEKGNCVVVGRCADYILRDRKDTVNVFVYAPLEERIQRKMALDESGKTEAEIKKEIIGADKRRAKYYNFYTGDDWGNSRNYDLCINTAKTGIDGAVDVIAEFFEKEAQKGILPD